MCIYILIVSFAGSVCDVVAALVVCLSVCLSVSPPVCLSTFNKCQMSLVVNHSCAER